MATKQQKIDERRIERIYQENCAGIQIDIMDIGKVFTAAQAAVDSGASDAELALMIVTFVNSIRKN